MRFSRLIWPVSKSPNQVTKNPFTKFRKICLSFSRLGHPPTNESQTSLSNLTIRALLAKQSRKWPKPKIFENFSKCFSRLEVLLAKESWKLLCKLATGALRLAWLMSESPKSKVKNFWIFWNFSKQKHFPKTTKILKNLFLFDQHMIEYVQHI